MNTDTHTHTHTHIYTHKHTYTHIHTHTHIHIRYSYIGSDSISSCLLGGIEVANFRELHLKIMVAVKPHTKDWMFRCCSSLDSVQVLQ